MQRLTSTCLLFTLLSSPVWAEDGKPAEPVEKITFVDHVLPIFRARCGSCHNPTDRKGSLVLDQYGLMMEGGSSGAVIEPGDASISYLFMLVNHEDEPKMPPNADKLPEKELEIIRKWIDLGALENAGSKANIKKKAMIAKIEVSAGRPENIAIPQSYLGEPVIVTEHSNAVTALATSPWASLTAVSGHHQVSIYNTQTMELMGVLPFPEGQPQILKFSRNGDLLMVGGGRGGASGKVVVYDVRTGERKAEAGAEYDEVLGADLSPDQSLIALGGPKKMLRVFTTGGDMQYENKKHTDWVMSAEFSPDGVLLASGDRSGGLVVWEADTGRIFYDLIGHKDSINDVSWRPDSNVLASASADGTIKLWNMENGSELKSWNAHGGGVTAVEYTREGDLVSIGRDKVSRLWDGNGGKKRDFPALPDIGMEISYDAESKRVIAGDWTGKLAVWNAENGEVVGQIDTNPPTLAMQIESLDKVLQAAKTDAEQKNNALAALQKKLDDRQLVAKQTTDAFNQANAVLNQAKAAKQSADKTLADANAALANASKQLTEAQAKYQQNIAAAKQAAETLKGTEQQLATTTKQLADTKQAEGAATAGVQKAKATAEAAAALAVPTAEEAALLATDANIKQAVEGRKAVAAAALASAEKAVQLIQQLANSRTQFEKELANLQNAVKTAQQMVQETQAQQQAGEKLVAERTAAQKVAQEMVAKAEPVAKQTAEQETSAVAAVNTAKAAMDKAVAEAKVTDEEQKALDAAKAQATAAQQLFDGYQERMKRLQAYQSQLASKAG